jgi:hypothetical protein
MIRIAISVEAFEPIARTLPLGSVRYENEINERGGLVLAFTAHAVELELV